MNYKKEAAHALLLSTGWLVLVFACYSPQTMMPDNSQPAQADAIRAARNLDSLKTPGDVSPAGRIVVDEAARALQECAGSLRAQGNKLNEVVKANNECKAEFEVQHAQLEKLQDQSGPLAWITDKFGRIGNAVFWFVMGGVFGGFVLRILQALIARVPL